MKKIILLGILFLFLQTLHGSVSATFFSDPNRTAVDNGEIRWGTFHGTTKWTTARNLSISVWNAEGVIKIAGDTASTAEDLSFTDYRLDDGYSGLYRHHLTTPDVIFYNDFAFEKYEACQRNHTTLHEMGHALNFAHTTTIGSVMREGRICQNYLGSYDKSELRRRW